MISISHEFKAKLLYNANFQGIGSTSFLYDGEGSAYAVCFYVGLKAAVSIGKNPKPGRDNPTEMVFMGILWLMGVAVFAVLIGKLNLKCIGGSSKACHFR